ncbi:MAG: hypothetical protein UHJ46_04075 [Treponema sp.]|nr:hypothetical protein [Treponema sp.]
MSYFVVPLTEAVVVSAAKALINRRNNAKNVVNESQESKLKLESFNKKISILQNMLYGGSFLLALEHIYHGEVVLYPPFITAMRTAEDTAEMLHEMATVGVSMSLLVTAAWGAGILIYKLCKKIAKKEEIA